MQRVASLLRQEVKGINSVRVRPNVRVRVRANVRVRV
jgi:hypothetical protein